MLRGGNTLLITVKRNYLYYTIHTKESFLNFLKDNNLLGKKIYCDCVDCLAEYVSFQKKLFHGRLNLQEICINFGYGSVINSFPLFFTKYDYVLISSIKPLMMAIDNRFFVFIRRNKINACNS